MPSGQGSRCWKLAVEDQQRQARTPRSARFGVAFDLLGVLVVALLIFVYFWTFWQVIAYPNRWSVPWLWRIGLAVAFILVWRMFFWALKVLLSFPVRVVRLLGGKSLRPFAFSCPRCQQAQTVYSEVERYLCEGCGTVSFLGTQVTTPPSLSACAYCGIESSVARTAGEFRCPDCNVLRVFNDPGTINQDLCTVCHSLVPSAVAERGVDEAGRLVGTRCHRPCPECEAPVPALATYCMACGAIQRFAGFEEPSHLGEIQVTRSLVGQAVVISLIATTFVTSLARSQASEAQITGELRVYFEHLLLFLEHFLAVVEDEKRADAGGVVQNLLDRVDLAYLAFLNGVRQAFPVPPSLFDPAAGSQWSASVLGMNFTSGASAEVSQQKWGWLILAKYMGIRDAIERRVEASPALGAQSRPWARSLVGGAGTLGAPTFKVNSASQIGAEIERLTALALAPSKPNVLEWKQTLLAPATRMPGAQAG